MGDVIDFVARKKRYDLLRTKRKGAVWYEGQHLCRMASMAYIMASTTTNPRDCATTMQLGRQ